jgi:hypothetical protein
MIDQIDWLVIMNVPSGRVIMRLPAAGSYFVRFDRDDVELRADDGDGLLLPDGRRAGDPPCRHGHDAEKRSPVHRCPPARNRARILRRSHVDDGDGVPAGQFRARECRLPRAPSGIRCDQWPSR